MYVLNFIHIGVKLISGAILKKNRDPSFDIFKSN